MRAAGNVWFSFVESFDSNDNKVELTYQLWHESCCHRLLIHLHHEQSGEQLFPVQSQHHLHHCSVLVSTNWML